MYTQDHYQDHWQDICPFQAGTCRKWVTKLRPWQEDNQRILPAFKVERNRKRGRERNIFSTKNNIGIVWRSSSWIFWVFWKCLTFSIKKDNTNLYKLWCLSAYKKWSTFLTSFLRYFKNIANLLLWVLWECLSPCSKLWCPNWWNQLVGNFDVYLHAKKLHLQFLFWDIVKALQTCYFGNFGNAWPSPSKL